jgi:hypothetical protein
MKRSHLTETQMIGFLKQVEADVGLDELSRQLGSARAPSIAGNSNRWGQSRTSNQKAIK